MGAQTRRATKQLADIPAPVFTTAGSGQLQTETRGLRGTKTEPTGPAVFIQLLSELNRGVGIYKSLVRFKMDDDLRLTQDNSHYSIP